MAYRFTDTSKWDDEWFIDLTKDEKLLFFYLIDNCDIGGFMELSTRKLSFNTGLSDVEVKVSLKGLERGFILSKDKRVLFLKNFIKHQKNLPLNRQNKAHKGIFTRFENYKDKFEIDLIELVNSQSPEQQNKVSLKGLQSPTGNGIGNYTTIQVNNNGIDFENFWNLYAKKVGDKPKVQKKWDNLKIEVQTKILAMLPEWKKQFTDWQYQPHPETFLNQQRWNDEVNIKKQQPTINFEQVAAN